MMDRRYLCATALPLAAAITIGAAASEPGRLANGGADACELITLSSKRMTLHDGATVVLDARSIATNGPAVMMVGSLVHVWQAGAGDDTPPAADRRIIGVLRDSSGVLWPVPAPVSGIEALHPHVASAGAAGWHVVLVTGKERVMEFDSADVWYGLFDGRTWRHFQHVTRAESARLLPGWGSHLIATPEGPAFAYSLNRRFVRESNTPENRGLVLLQRRETRWVVDTLRTWDAAWAVHLIADGAGGVRAVYTGEYWANGRSHGPVLFMTRHDPSGWSDPRVVLDVSPEYLAAPIPVEPGSTGTVTSSPRYVAAPMLVEPWSAGTIVSWITGRRGMDLDFSAHEDTEWGIVSTDGTVRRLGRVASAEIGDRPAALQLDAHRAVWFIRNGDSRQELRAFLAVDSTVHDLGTARVPFDNFVTHGAVLPDGRILIVTGGLGRTPSEPLASSYLTEFAVRCTSERD